MAINKFTTLLDLARQAKIISGETATFDGKIEVGIPFSGYPTGVDTGTTVSLGVVSSEDAVFSGNTGTTVFDVSNTGSTNYDAIFSGYSATTWSNPLFSGNTSGLTLPITPLSASTQIVGPFWTLTQTGMTGDYVIGTQYTGYSVTYSFFNVSQFGTGFTYSGFTTATQENFSAGTLDYKGPLDYISSVEDATIDGRLTTNKLTVTGGASAGSLGYVLTQTGDTGEVGWVFNSASGTTDTNLSNTNLTQTIASRTYTLPALNRLNFQDSSNLNMLQLDEGSSVSINGGINNTNFQVKGQTNPNLFYVDVSSNRVGVGISSPSETLHINGDVRIDGNPGILEIYDTTNLKTQLLQNSYGALTFNINSTGDEEAFIVNNAPSGNTVFRCGENGSNVDDVMVLYGSGNTASNNELIFSGDSEPLVYSRGNLEVFGNIGIKQLPTGSANQGVSIDAQGKLTNDTSDERLKENILSLNNSLTKLLQISGVSYNWIDRNSGSDDTFYGFIAQQLEKVDSNLTFTNENSGYMGIRSQCLTPLIVESIKEIHNNPSIPNYTPTSSNDTYGNIGNITTDDDYLYIKTNNGWKRTSLQSF
ncbi:tail fiber domain-containing protein [bacterium]|nr:tail fiber domain-containing protein [bacterium]